MKSRITRRTRFGTCETADGQAEAWTDNPRADANLGLAVEAIFEPIPDRNMVAAHEARCRVMFICGIGPTAFPVTLIPQRATRRLSMHSNYGHTFRESGSLDFRTL